MPVTPDARPVPRARRAPEPCPDAGSDSSPAGRADPEPNPFRFYQAPRPDGRRGADVRWRFDDWAQV